MAQYALFLDRDRCVGCQTCEVACEAVNHLPNGPKLMKVITIGPYRVGGKLRMHFLPMRCMHCGKPACLDACKQGAISRRPDGIVLIEESACIGCKLCIEACPFGAIKFDETKDVAVKCNLCVDRLEKGLAPMCVKHCPASALRVGNLNDLIEGVQQSKADLMCRL
jgi:Fe-S-cluster-containing dehydrogenase component